MERPSPEHFLNLLRARKRGRFKLYIGMAAGVGKTYRMLSEAHDLLARGVDVQIGFVVTHGRKDTDARLVGLPLISPRTAFYQGKSLEEMDLDAILQRRPEVVIVDELAHSNVPGSQHEKRYQDVEALLEAGISVISAVNIQHVESLNPVVARITGVDVSERIPDRIVMLADEVVNIDLTADELIQRLREGKIYAPDKVETALRNFFQPEHLLQLRELALREVAGRLERRLDAELPKERRVTPQRIACAISTNERSGRHMIRKVARLAASYQAQWFVLYVQTPQESTLRINAAAQRHLLNNFNLTAELGGEVVQLQGRDVAQAIVAAALERSCNILVLGKARPIWWKTLMGRDLLGRFLRLVEDKEIDLLIIN